MDRDTSLTFRHCTLSNSIMCSDSYHMPILSLYHPIIILYPSLFILIFFYFLVILACVYICDLL